MIYEAGKWIIEFFQNLARSMTSFARITSQAVGSITAVSKEWGAVTYIGPMIMALIGAIIAFIIIDFMRDLF